MKLVSTTLGKVEKRILESYIQEFAEKYAKKGWYRFGEMSGKVIFERITYGDLFSFLDNIEAKSDLIKNLKEINVEVKDEYDSLSRNQWNYFWDYIFENFEQELVLAILKEEGLEKLPEKREPFVESYDFEGQKVVFLSFYQACNGYSDIYAIPEKLAHELCLEDYQGEEMSRFDELWHTLSPYEVKGDLIVKAQKIETYNYD